MLRANCEMGLSRALSSLFSLSNWCPSPLCVFKPTVAFCHSQFCSEHQPLKCQSKSHTVFQLTSGSAAKEQMMRWNQRGVQWPFFCVNSFSCSSQHCSFLLLSCLLECVTSRGSIFSRTELYCSVEVFCAGWSYGEKSFREKWSGELKGKWCTVDNAWSLPFMEK